ncbi:hypothetical protein B0H11DRAFT_2246992 [Mycena galericulata]|nr:hypothetical protein B0H11DRAFT_2246992 [Mycena galericulata]
MDAQYLADMPPEILSEIFAFLDPKTMLLCCSVSRIWHDTITGSPRLQYAIELWVEGLVAGDSDSLTPTDTLRALHQRRRAWYNLEWTSETVIEVESLHTCRSYELVGGMFALQEHGPDFCAIALPPVVNVGQAWVKSALSIEPVDFQDFAMDPTQDLLVVLYQASPGLAHLECLTLSSRQTHRLSPHPILSFSLDRDPFMWVSIQIADDVVALSFPDINLNRLILWNWRKGIVLQDLFRIRSPVHVGDFEFLSSRSFILAFPFDSGRIEIYAFEGDRRDSTIHVATLRLPELVANRSIESMRIHSGPICARPMPKRPFSISNERRIYVFCMEYDNSKWKRLFVHYRTLQKYVVDYEREKWMDPVDVSWDEWGPQNSRIVPGGYYGWIRHAHGERVVVPMDDAHGWIQVLDFGVIPGHLPSVDPPQAIGVTTELHMEPTTISGPEDGVFEDAVTTSLPFKSTMRFVGDDFDVFLIDQDHIIGVNEENDAMRNQMTVFAF